MARRCRLADQSEWGAATSLGAPRSNSALFIEPWRAILRFCTALLSIVAKFRIKLRTAARGPGAGCLVMAQSVLGGFEPPKRASAITPRGRSRAMRVPSAPDSGVS